MKNDTQNFDTASPRSVESESAQARRFFKISAGFLAGFLLAALAADGIAAKYLHWTDQRGGIGPEVQVAWDRVAIDNDFIKVVVLGDSVAHQLFLPSTEPGPQVKFIASNQAITVAGHCYLAENAMAHCHGLQDIYLFYLPGAWANDMPRELTHDYFCGHFHTTGEVAEVFKVKRDFELSFAHAGRWLLPHLMAINSLSRPAFAMQPNTRDGSTNAASAGDPPDPERLLTWTSGLFAPRPAANSPEPAGRRPIVMSPVSRYFLEKFRDDCRRRGIRLHILPCPISSEKNRFEFVDTDHLYDLPMIQDVPADQLIDAVHFKDECVRAARERVVRFYNLEILGTAIKK